MDTSLTNYEWFREHLAELAKQYDGKYIVLKECRVIGSYDTFDEAWTETLKREKAGTFIIQLCTEDETQTAQTYFTDMVYSHTTCLRVLNSLVQGYVKAILS